MTSPRTIYFFFFFNDTATTEIYTLSLHDALPISNRTGPFRSSGFPTAFTRWRSVPPHNRAVQLMQPGTIVRRSEEHTSELQSPCNLVCRLLLEKKKKKKNKRQYVEYKIS